MQTRSTQRTEDRHTFRSIPQAIDAEESFLSACLLGGADEGVRLLSPGDFFKPAHQKIFAAIIALQTKGEPVELVTLANLLRENGQLNEVGGASALSRLVDTVPAAVSIEQYAEIVKRVALRRTVISRCNDLSRLAFDEPDINTVLDAAKKISHIDHPAKANVFASYAQMADSEPEKWEKIGQNGTGVPSGYAKIDNMTGGFQDSDLIIIAARPAMGKSALMINIAENAASSKHPKAGPVAIFSLEMSKSQLYMRQTARVARLDTQLFRLGGITPGQWQKIIDAQQYLHGLPIYIDDSPMLRVREIERRAHMAVDKYGVRMVIIDHLQKIRGDNSYQRKDLEVGDITAVLKATAKNLSIPVILLSQLNRKCETRDNKRPMLSDLRESGDIEQDADIVAFLYRDEYYNKDSEHKGTAEFNIAKHRNGPVGPVFLTWIPWRQSFENLAR